MLALEDAGYFADVHSCEWWYGVSCACTVMSVLINSGLLCSLGRCRLFCRCPLLWMMACLVPVQVSRTRSKWRNWVTCRSTKANAWGWVFMEMLQCWTCFVSKVGHGCGQVVQGQGLRSPMLCAALAKLCRRQSLLCCMVHTEHAKMAAVSCGTSHASSVSTPLRWIFKKRAIKKLFTHVESHASAVSPLERGE